MEEPQQQQQQQQQQSATSDQDGAPLLRQVFISHTGQDEGAKEFAACVLKPALEAAGMKVYMDFSDLSLGSAWPQLLVTAACLSAVTVVVLSKTYTERFWCMLELDLALHGHPEHPRQQQPLVIPVFYDDPKRLASVQDIQQRWAAARVPPERQQWVQPQRWSANITDMRERLMNVRLSAFSMSNDAQWQVAQMVVAAAAPRVVVLAHVDDSVVGYQEQLGLLLSKLAVGDPKLGDVLGLWLHGLGEGVADYH